MAIGHGASSLRMLHLDVVRKDGDEPAAGGGPETAFAGSTSITKCRRLRLLRGETTQPRPGCRPARSDDHLTWSARSRASFAASPARLAM